jgi:hypothetical protein
MGNLTNAVVNIKKHTVFVGSGAYVKAPGIVFPLQLVRGFPAVCFLIAERFQRHENISFISLGCLHSTFFKTNRLGKRKPIGYYRGLLFDNKSNFTTKSGESKQNSDLGQGNVIYFQVPEEILTAKSNKFCSQALFSLSYSTLR